MNSFISSVQPLPEKGDVLPTGPHKPELMAAVLEVLEFIGDRPLDKALEVALNKRFGPNTQAFGNLLKLLRNGVDEGWACYSEINGPDYRRGRLAKPSESTNGFSVETGMLRNVLGNYHRHPRGEINLIGPVDRMARFCGHDAGWKVFPANSCHFPTVTGGTVTMLFFLPGGEIEYFEPPSTHSAVAPLDGFQCG